MAECLESIRTQDFNDYEVIIVDDGSDDSSLVRLNKIVKESGISAISIIHVEHAGLYEGRRTAFTTARGHYVVNLDSDDRLFNSNSLRNVFEAMGRFDDPDILMVNAACDEAGTVMMQRFEKTLGKTGEVDRREFLDVFASTYALNSFCLKVVNLEVARAITINEPGLVMCEDRLLTAQALQNSITIAVENIVLTYYRQHPESSVHREFRIEDYLQQACVERHVINILAAEGIDTVAAANSRIKWIAGDFAAIRGTVPNFYRRKSLYSQMAGSAYFLDCWTQRIIPGSHLVALVFCALAAHRCFRALDIAAFLQVHFVSCAKFFFKTFLTNLI